MTPVNDPWPAKCWLEKYVGPVCPGITMNHWILGSGWYIDRVKIAIPGTSRLYMDTYAVHIENIELKTQFSLIFG